ncbi:MAG TPA: phosphate signaling complex protein PhoU [Burkholderiaceae bacterium]|nr:phosphate signaling complex protein PhoU [Burkholderiaceae bacterium]
MVHEHTFRAFDTDIDGIRSAVTTMGGLVDRQLVRAVDAVKHGDLRLVAQVLADEEVVNRLHVETDLRCNQIIARRQPIAVDLREIIAVLHSINDLERIGDEAKKIAMKSQTFENIGLPIAVERVERMTSVVCEMLRSAIDAFVRHDTQLAKSLISRDDEVDSLRDELVRELIEKMTRDPSRVSQALAMIFIVQSIERIGDHAKNIAEYVVTVVDGIDPRHGRGAAQAGSGRR